MREDRKGRGGFIQELTNFTHNEPYDEKLNQNELIFTLKADSKEVIQKQQKEMSNNNLLLQIVYLRTYENAGEINVFYCGQFIKSLNSLWPNYQHYHYSLSQAVSIPLPHCAYGGDKEPTVSIVHKVRFQAGKGKVLERKSGTQNFKIMSIQVCTH